ncbi:MAG: helix-turn-helix domain-containing protein [Acidimicrobiia bacterium]
MTMISDVLPVFLKVEEAARILRISRTSAYELANQWLASEGRVGLPVVRLGRSLRVPRKAIEDMIGADLSGVSLPGGSNGATPSDRPPRDADEATRPTPTRKSRNTDQLDLFDVPTEPDIH